MTGEFTKTFHIQRDINQVFDVITQHFISRGFSMNDSMRPNQINFSMKGSLFTMDMAKLPQKLVVNLNKNDSGAVTVRVNASITGVVKTAGDQAKWEVGVTSLENLINTTIQPSEAPAQAPSPPATSQPLCPSCQKQVSPDFAVCPYCSASLKATNTCSGCNKELQPEFAVCPYCGQAK